MAFSSMRSTCIVQRDTPVDSDNIGACAAHGGERLAGTHPEVNARDLEVLDRREDSPAGGQCKAVIIDIGQTSRPAVEELYRLASVFDPAS